MSADKVFLPPWSHKYLVREDIKRRYPWFDPRVFPNLAQLLRWPA